MEEENQFDYLLSKIDNEGFDYCFVGYSNWEDIQDEKFHKLRKQYISAQENLENYIKQNSNNGE